MPGRALSTQAGRDGVDPREMYDRAAQSPWIRTVRKVRCRPSGESGAFEIELEAEFRKPVAKIRLADGFAFLGAEGIILPPEEAPRGVASESGKQICFARESDVPAGMYVKPIHYIVIQGAAEAGWAVGSVWPGKDVAAALALVAMVSARPYADQITVVDVHNYDGRASDVQPHLRLYAQLPNGCVTDIRFGRFPRDEKDFVVSPRRKLSYLDQYASRHGGLVAGVNTYLDLRYDQLHVSIH